MGNKDRNLEGAPLLIRRGRLKDVVGLSPSTVRRLELLGVFPKRRRIGGVVGWVKSEVEEFLKNQEVVK